MAATSLFEHRWKMLFSALDDISNRNARIISNVAQTLITGGTISNAIDKTAGANDDP